MRQLLRSAWGSGGDVFDNDPPPEAPRQSSVSLPANAVARSLAPAILLTLAACVSAPPAVAPAADQQLRIEGSVVTVDTDPWTYDGNAVVTVDTAAGRVAVQFPARWNLCKAQPPGDLRALKPGDRVLAVGAATAQGEMVVCEQPQHLLRKVD